MKDLKKDPGIWVILLVSLLAVLLLTWLLYLRNTQTEVPEWSNYLPYLNASLNFLSATCLVVAFKKIQAKKLEEHKKWMLGAFGLSTAFLVSYLFYHYLHGDTKFMGPLWAKWIYFPILITHIITSIVALPMVLTSFYLSLTQKIEAHKKLSRWTYPLWLYVSVTGVLVTILLKTLG